MECSNQASLSITNSQSLLKLMSIELVMPSNHLIHCHSLLFLPLIFPRKRIFSTELVLCIRWPKHWSFSFSISPSNECAGLISFRIDCAPRDSQESYPTPQFKSISSACQFRRCGLDLWISTIPWRRKGQPTPVFLPGKFHGQEVCWAVVHGDIKELNMT